MADLYKSRPGALVKTSIPTPTFLTVQGLKLSGGKIMATSFKLDRSQDVQHQKTLSKDLYSYAFGESMGRVQVGGLLFFGQCGGGASSAAAIGVVNSFFNANNIYTKKGPVICTVGSGNSFKCYLENLSVNGEAGPYNMGSFNFGFSTIPARGK